MIARYEVKDVSKIWGEEFRFQKLLEVEIALMKALEVRARIPAGTALQFKNVKIRPDRIREIEETTRHDVIAFCTSITEQVKPEHARYFHFGVTSSDILDTALTLQIRDSLWLVKTALRELIAALNEKVSETKDLLSMGRSHGMAAEPMVFAQKFLSARVELERRLSDYEVAYELELTGQLSGAVGNYTVLDPEIEQLALDELKLKVEPVSSQVIPRDRIAKIVTMGALTASALERLAVEFRHLHHSDIAEVHEGFAPGQKGSSTMPHKKNPISSENITGLSRLIRSHVSVALEDSVLWHERDISHSSAERLFLPDHFGLLVYALRRMTNTVKNLEIHRETIQAKVDQNFMTLSSAILHQLIEQNEVAREDLYAIVQAASFEAKSLEQLVKGIESRLQAQGLKWDSSKLSWPKIRETYFSRFEQLLKRT
jgi:adenylosuccinate lyase